MPHIELVYDRECPNVTHARANLLRAFVRANLTPRWSEYLHDDAPPHARGFGSPTILVDGRDVAGVSAGAEECCRVYTTEGGTLAGVPAVAAIAAALASSEPDASAGAPPQPDRSGGGWGSSLGVLPGVGAALLPKVACPACWPAYAGFLGSLGLPFLMETRWLLPLTAVFLVIAVGVLAFRARRRRGYGPFVLGLVAAAFVLIGKFTFESDPAMYAGIGLLVAASLWNSWPRRTRRACEACAPARA